MTANMIVTQCAGKFTKLSRFIPEFVASKQMKMRIFEKGLDLYIRHQLAGQPIHTYQDLYERATKVEGFRSELKALNPNPRSQKRKWIKQ